MNKRFNFVSDVKKGQWYNIERKNKIEKNFFRETNLKTGSAENTFFLIFLQFFSSQTFLKSSEIKKCDEVIF